MFFIKSKGKYYAFSEDSKIIASQENFSSQTISLRKPNYKDDDFLKSDVMIDAGLRAAIPLGNTAGVVTGGKSGRKYHLVNWLGGAAGATVGVLPGLVLKNDNLTAAGAYLGKIAGSVATAGYQKDQIDKLNKKSKKK